MLSVLLLQLHVVLVIACDVPAFPVDAGRQAVLPLCVTQPALQITATSCHAGAALRQENCSNATKGKELQGNILFLNGATLISTRSFIGNVCEAIMQSPKLTTKSGKPERWTAKIQNTDACDGTVHATQVRFEVSNCGDNERNDDEECDGSDFGSSSDCGVRQDGWTGGQMSCDEHCKLVNTTCTKCGDGIQEGDEQCDKDDIPTTCLQHHTTNTTTTTTAGTANEAIQYTGGKMGCTSECKLEASNCWFCGNNITEGEEECDGSSIPSTCEDRNIIPQYNGTLTCNEKCKIVDSSCTPPCPPDQPPVARCRERVTVLRSSRSASSVVGGGGVVVTGEDIDNGSTDNCGVKEKRVSGSSIFTWSDQNAQHTVVLTVVDEHDNQDTCESTIQLVDDTVQAPTTTTTTQPAPSQLPASSNDEAEEEGMGVIIYAAAGGAAFVVAVALVGGFAWWYYKRHKRNNNYNEPTMPTLPNGTTGQQLQVPSHVTYPSATTLPAATPTTVSTVPAFIGVPVPTPATTPWGSPLKVGVGTPRDTASLCSGSYR
eukprot:TRINITY_DN66391_c5_g1_i1.p1 TRINITY_DN66391_c5_g1~~TRINITY_DN66391_c5_g1_i1.p1  ORF type:complete len:544 (-),score=72.27 TRINITY_DN66391_c5_g1_i1:185-1816(-)